MKMITIIKYVHTVMSSLIETLRATQAELSECLASLFDEKDHLSVAIKQAEEASSSALRSLQEKVYIYIYIYDCVVREIIWLIHD